MIKAKVGSKVYDVKFHYTRLTKETEKIPHDTWVTIYEESKPEVVAQGIARLHPTDRGRFQYKLGRKIALRNAVAQTSWSYPEKTEFWGQMMPYIRNNG
jgi:hypothetical protein